MASCNLRSRTHSEALGPPKKRQSSWASNLWCTLQNRWRQGKQLSGRRSASASGKATIEIAGIQSPAVRQAETIPYAGQVKNGSEVFAIKFDAPNPNMKFVNPKLDLAITLWHGKRDPADPPWHDRNEVHAMLTLLASEVRTVIDTIIAACR